MLSASQFTAIGGCIVLAAAGAWLLLSEFPVAHPGQPTTSAGRLQVLEAAVPAIGDFSAFNVNQQNPFIPLALRRPASRPMARSIDSREKGQAGPQPAADHPLPIVNPTDADRPAITGVLLSRQGAQALITFPGAAHATVMVPGDTAHGWTLLEVVGGNAVRLRENGSGATHELAIPVPATSDQRAKLRDGARNDRLHRAVVVAAAPSETASTTTPNREL